MKGKGKTMKEEYRYYAKYGNVGEETYNTFDTLEIYEKLAKDMIRKKLHNVPSIKSIREKRSANGTMRIITVYYYDTVLGNTYKGIYTINW